MKKSLKKPNSLKSFRPNLEVLDERALMAFGLFLELDLDTSDGDGVGVSGGVYTEDSEGNRTEHGVGVEVDTDASDGQVGVDGGVFSEDSDGNQSSAGLTLNLDGQLDNDFSGRQTALDVGVFSENNTSRQEAGLTTNLDFQGSTDGSDNQTGMDLGVYSENGTNRQEAGLTVNVDSQADQDSNGGQTGVDFGVFAEDSTGERSEAGVTVNGDLQGDDDARGGQAGIDVGLFAEQNNGDRGEIGVTVNGDLQGDDSARGGQAGIDVGLFAEQNNGDRGEIGVTVNADYQGNDADHTGQAGLDVGLFAETDDSDRYETGVTANLDGQYDDNSELGQFGADLGFFYETDGGTRGEVGATLNGDFQGDADGRGGQGGLDLGFFAEDTSQRYEAGITLNGDLQGNQDGSGGQAGVDFGLFAESSQGNRGELGLSLNAGGETDEDGRTQMTHVYAGPFLELYPAVQSVALAEAGQAENALTSDEETNSGDDAEESGVRRDAPALVESSGPAHSSPGIIAMCSELITVPCSSDPEGPRDTSELDSESHVSDGIEFQFENHVSFGNYNFLEPGASETVIGEAEEGRLGLAAIQSGTMDTDQAIIRMFVPMAFGNPGYSMSHSVTVENDQILVTTQAIQPDYPAGIYYPAVMMNAATTMHVSGLESGEHTVHWSFSGPGPDVTTSMDFVIVENDAMPSSNDELSKNVEAGDANGDLRFDQMDVVQVLKGDKYLSGERASWDEGDWNDDGVFDQLDLVAALQTGNYLQGQYAEESPRPYIAGSRGLEEYPRIVLDQIDSAKTEEVASKAANSMMPVAFSAPTAIQQFTSVSAKAADSVFAKFTSLSF